MRIDTRDSSSIVQLLQNLKEAESMLIGETPDGDTAIANQLDNELEKLKIEVIDDKDNVTNYFFNEHGTLLNVVHGEI
ncbi:hypothetical protein ACFZL0_000619 [Staphylococcus pseudintermedius]|uniref:hypothetical protein n=1 Tax=Staphylococcus pseudintermedius TaxID=283734 RepID=UPI0019313B09|nr:hypothetical protein [Staphylococcus pseudintermedius]EGQ4060139.1 hypothetical protein [Staphylococcus pseudintermedius]EJD8533335.1 hypothetical protein [Staphylococcus pseudintermedius]MBM0287824.1 hypothetical protein [Staphylococcus pseudintermedius]